MGPKDNEKMEKSLEDVKCAMKEGFESLQSNLRYMKEDLESVSNDISHIKDTLISNLIRQNKLQSDRIASLEREVKENKIKIEVDNQKSRENNIEISGISLDVVDDSLEAHCIKILGSVDVKCSPSEIQACHRLPSRSEDSTPVIIKFVNRKTAEKALSNRTNANAKKGLTGKFISLNLSPYFKHLFYLCRKLRKENYIDRCFPNSNGFIKVRFGGRSVRVTHLGDLTELFPEFDFGISK